MRENFTQISINQSMLIFIAAYHPLLRQMAAHKTRHIKYTKNIQG